MKAPARKNPAGTPRKPLPCTDRARRSGTTVGRGAASNITGGHAELAHHDEVDREAHRDPEGKALAVAALIDGVLVVLLGVMPNEGALLLAFLLAPACE